jgi:hypothetical protein
MVTCPLPGPDSRNASGVVSAMVENRKTHRGELVGAGAFGLFIRSFGMTIRICIQHSLRGRCRAFQVIDHNMLRWCVEGVEPIVMLTKIRAACLMDHRKTNPQDHPRMGFWALREWSLITPRAKRVISLSVRACVAKSIPSLNHFIMSQLVEEFP